MAAPNNSHHPGKLSGFNIALCLALLLVLASIVIRIVWLARTDWPSLLSNMTPIDWLLVVVIVPTMIYLQRRTFHS